MLPLAWLSRQSGFEVTTIWKLSVATVALQACLALLLVHWQMKKRLLRQATRRAPRWAPPSPRHSVDCAALGDGAAQRFEAGDLGFDFRNLFGRDA
ncbi:hypothetical protein LP420_16080 [Massilia sp. B-10]|nr:hypothetical protein LP420_16080 [Massilia sp. B-10]